MLVYPSKLHLFSLAPLLTVSFRVCNMRNIHSSLNGSIGTSILAASSQLCSMGDTNSSFLCSALIGTSLTTTLLLCCALCKTKTPPSFGLHPSKLHRYFKSSFMPWPPGWDFLELTFPCPLSLYLFIPRRDKCILQITFLKNDCCLHHWMMRPMWRRLIMNKTMMISHHQQVDLPQLKAILFCIIDFMYI